MLFVPAGVACVPCANLFVGAVHEVPRIVGGSLYVGRGAVGGCRFAHDAEGEACGSRHRQSSVCRRNGGCAVGFGLGYVAEAHSALLSAVRVSGHGELPPRRFCAVGRGRGEGYERADGGARRGVGVPHYGAVGSCGEAFGAPRGSALSGTHFIYSAVFTGLQAPPASCGGSSGHYGERARGAERFRRLLRVPSFWRVGKLYAHGVGTGEQARLLVSVAEEHGCERRRGGNDECEECV